MMECKHFKKDLVAFLYGELLGKERERLTSHLDSCPHCRNELGQLKETLKRADSLKDDIENAFASVDWETLPFEISEAVFKKDPSPPRESRVRVSRFLFQPKLRPVYAGVLVGVLLGSLATFIIFRVPVSREVKTAELFAPRDFLERVELEMARRETLDYLDKSQYLLLDFVQSPSEEKAKFWQREFVSQRARGLLSKKKYINPQLSKFQMAKAKVICDQIELLFYELTQISDQLSATQIREIQNLIEEKQLLLKIKLLKKELEDSEV